jgi:uncharacterized protein (TIGR02145 family)
VCANTGHQVTGTANHVGSFLTGANQFGNGDHNLWGANGAQWNVRASAPTTAGDWLYTGNNPCLALGDDWRVPSRWEMNDLHNGTGEGNTIDSWGPGATHGNFAIARTYWEWFPGQNSNEIAGAAIVTNTAGNTAATIILPAAGVRVPGGGFGNFGTHGYFWSSTWGQTYPIGMAWNIVFNSTAVNMDAPWQAHGHSIRCVQ